MVRVYSLSVAKSSQEYYSPLLTTTRTKLGKLFICVDINDLVVSLFCQLNAFYFSSIFFKWEITLLSAQEGKI